MMCMIFFYFHLGCCFFFVMFCDYITDSYLFSEKNSVMLKRTKAKLKDNDMIGSHRIRIIRKHVCVYMNVIWFWLMLWDIDCGWTLLDGTENVMNWKWCRFLICFIFGWSNYCNAINAVCLKDSSHFLN